MAIARDRCIGCERSQEKGSRVALAHEATMTEGSPGDACGSLMSRPRFRLATLAARFSALVLFPEPSLADNYQAVVGLGSICHDHADHRVNVLHHLVFEGDVGFDQSGREPGRCSGRQRRPLGVETSRPRPVRYRVRGTGSCVAAAREPGTSSEQPSL